MTKKICFLLFVLLSMQGFAQTGIGTSTPHASAKLDVTSTTMGFLPPRMTSVQRLEISNPAEGLMVYQTDGTSGLYYRGATGWIYIINSSNNVLPILNGGTGTTTSTGSGSVVLSTSPTLVTPTLGIATGTSLSLSSTTAGTSTTTGALTVAGGAGIGGALNANTLSLSNSTFGTSSLVLRNGNAALSFTDVPQIRMGWSGGSAGTSQFAQIIHTRHNSGPSNNAIDFYLSNGTADNTITSGSTRAMSITSPGDVEITGKLNIGNPTGNVVTKAAGFVGRGVDVTLGNLKVRFAASGNMSLQISTEPGTTWVARGTDQIITDVSASTSINISITSNPIYLWPPGIDFRGAGNSETCIIVDVDTKMTWRIIGIVGPIYLNNFISIERIL